MLIRNADIHGHGPGDLRIVGETIAQIGQLEPTAGEPVIDAAGGALLPGLHDHHIHLAALAARTASVPCGPPEVTGADELASILQRPGSGWIRGIGYHESVMGLPDAKALDELVRDRPLRIQHRSGRMWLLNTLALMHLLERAPPPPGLERARGGYTGRLFDEDAWLRTTLGSVPPDFSAVSRALAASGVTGITDMSPANDAAMAAHFSAEIGRGALIQNVTLAGTLALSDAERGEWRIGPAKLHLHEAALPEFETATRFISRAHAQGRAVAVHCVSEVELVFALALFEATGCVRGDRIEHVSVAAMHLVDRMHQLGLQACVQPHFIAERGDRYLADVEPRHQGDLYRLASLVEAGIALAGGSDAPFGSADPWAAMAAAVSRKTLAGAVIGPREALAPETALSLFLADPADLPRQRILAPGEPADCVLLDRPWRQAREQLGIGDVRLTLASGRIIHDRIDKAPIAGSACVDPAS
jgi:predicted amidohydrolase YtcJ